MERGRRARARPTSAGRATGPAKRRRKRGGSPRRSRCRLARRKASAGPAMSSSSECGTMTKRTSISWARVIMGRGASKSQRGSDEKGWPGGARGPMSETDRKLSVRRRDRRPGPLYRREGCHAHRDDPRHASRRPGRWTPSHRRPGDPRGGGARGRGALVVVRVAARRAICGGPEPGSAREHGGRRASSPATTFSPTPTESGSRPPRFRPARSDGAIATSSRCWPAAAFWTCSTPPVPRRPAPNRARSQTSAPPT